MVLLSMQCDLQIIKYCFCTNWHSFLHTKLVHHGVLVGLSWPVDVIGEVSLLTKNPHILKSVFRARHEASYGFTFFSE